MTTVDTRPNRATANRPHQRRDPFVDLLRVGAIMAVVFGHWIMPVLASHGGRLDAGNSMATPGWWVITWIFQVMPVFFIAGGAANRHSLTAARDRGETANAWLAARLRRLIIPVLPLLAVWLPLPVLLRDLGVPAQPVALAGTITAQLLWFLAVYVLTVAATPLMVAADRRFGRLVPLALGGAAILVDLLRFNGLPLAGFANEAFIWLAMQQLGIGYAAGRYDRLTGRAAIGLGCAGLAATALLVCFGPYPASMIGLPNQAVSNMSPASLCLFTLGVAQFGLLLAARDRLVRWTERPAVTRVLRAVSARCMSLYLWHMTAMVVVAGITVFGFGYATPQPGSWAWLVATPLWLAAAALVLRPLLAWFSRFEALAPRGRLAPPATRRLAVAVPLCFGGLLGIAAFGFANPMVLPFVLALLVGFGLSWPGSGRWLVDNTRRLGTKVLVSLVDAVASARR